MNLELIDYLFGNHYDALPLHIQDKKFKVHKKGLFKATANSVVMPPISSWVEKGEILADQLSRFTEGSYYIFTFLGHRVFSLFARNPSITSSF